MQERIAIVGAGLMGHGIAQVFACAGHPVKVFDENADALENLHSRVRANLALLSRETGCVDLIRLSPSLEDAVASADAVFEAVAEDLEVKRRVIGQVSRHVGGDTVIATNTSVIAIRDIAANARDRTRVLGTHWWNPPYLIPLVEVTEAEETSGASIAWMMQLLERVGKAPVHVRKDIPGFVGNRLQHAMWREAIALVGAGVCDAESIDRIVKDSFGLRLSVLGPLENADLVGLDLTLAIHEYLLPHLDRAPGPAPVLARLVEDGSLGMKSGRGFRHWTDLESTTTRERLNDQLVTLLRSRAQASDRVEPS